MKKLLIVLLFSILFACEYEPSGTNYVEVDPTLKPFDFDAKLLWDQDTVYWSSKKRVNLIYKLNHSENQFHECFIYVDSVLEFNSDKENEWFLFDPESKKAFTEYKILLELHFSSGTASIADIVGAERIILKKEWTLIVYNFDYIQLPEPEFGVEDGQLKVTWQKPPLPGRHQYHINRKFNSSYSIYFNKENDKEENSVYDPISVGESVEYAIGFVDEFDDIYYYPRVTYNEGINQIYTEKIGEAKYRVFWDKCKFYKNFKGYELKAQHPYNTNIVKNDINDTSLVMEGQYAGIKNNLTLLINANDNDKYYKGYSISGSIINDTLFYPYKQIFNLGKNHILFTPNKSNIKIIDAVTDKEITNYTHTWYNNLRMAASADGNNIVYSDYDNLAFVKDMDFNSSDILSITEISNNNLDCKSSQLSALSISNNQILVMKKHRIIVLYDLNNEKIISVLTFNEYLNTAKISPNGKYLFISSQEEKSWLYEIKSNELELITEYDNFSFIHYNPMNDEEAIIQYYKEAVNKLVDLKTFTSKKEYNLSDPIFGVDFYTNSFVTKNAEFISVYDINSAQIIKERQIFENTRFELYKNWTVYNANGVKVFLDK